MDARTPFVRPARLLPFLLVPIIVLALVAGLLTTLDPAAFRPLVARRLSAESGRAVTIGAIRRIDHALLHPGFAIDDVRVAQPSWVGGGDMLRIRSATIRLPLLPLLVGRVEPDSIDLDGVALALVRADSAHANWLGRRGGGARGPLGRLTIHDGGVTLLDREYDDRLTARVEADDRGFRLAGQGSLAGHRATVSLVGAAIIGPAPWPFRFDYRSAIASLSVRGLADTPLDFDHFSARARASADDLRDLNRLIDAGLPATQPVRLTAIVRHDAPGWRLADLTGRIGRSDVRAHVTIGRDGERTLLDADLISNGFDFNDLSSDAALARSAAQDRVTGPRLIPATPIRLDYLQRLDGTLRYDLRRILSRDPSVFRAVRGTLTLAHGVLTAAPLFATLPAGQVMGTAQVRHHAGTPLLTLDLRVANSQMSLLTRSDVATGPLSGRTRLTGRGDTFRAALSRASGSVVWITRRGTIMRRAALFAGGDLGRALFEGGTQRTGIRCAIARFDVTDGVARAAPMVIDTDVSRIEGGGTVDIASERFAFTLTGHPKLGHAVRIDQPVMVEGTLLHPTVVPPHVPKTVGTVFKLLGRAIAGNSLPPAADADCAGLAAKALR